MTTASFRSAGVTGARRNAPFTTRVDSYEIVKRLADGGMAELFLARARGPQGFEKLVVIKKILPRLTGDPRFVQLLLDEAKVAASLDHPCIAQVYDLGMLDGEYCFVMEYVHGRDLRAMLQRAGRLPIEHAVLIARDIASALHHAHTRRSSEGYALDIIHRDVSPSNIAVSFEGAVKLLDLGVAKASTSSIDTRTGIVSGKVAYMSPEQARGQRIDRRTDLYSLGIVLWEMVTGRGLYRAENDLATAQLVIDQLPGPPSQWRPECPAALDRLVLRALSHDVDERFQTARELQLALETFAREHALWVSTIALADAMHAWFHDEIAAWHDAEGGRATLDEPIAHALGISDDSDVVTVGPLPRRTTPSGRVLQLMPADPEPRAGDSSITHVLPRGPASALSMITAPFRRPPPTDASGEIQIQPRATDAAASTPAPRRSRRRWRWHWPWLALGALAAVVLAFAITRAVRRRAEPAPAPAPGSAPAAIAPPTTSPIGAPTRPPHPAPHPAAKPTHRGKPAPSKPGRRSDVD